MNEDPFDGTQVLERLAEIGKVDAFYEAVDSDDFRKAKALMKHAGLDAETISKVLREMAEGDNAG